MKTATAITTWADVSPDLVRQTLECIDDGRVIYSCAHFPAAVRHLVQRDNERHVSNRSKYTATIFATDGSVLESVQGVFALQLAHRIAAEREVAFERKSGRHSQFVSIRDAVLAALPDSRPWT